MDDFSRTDFSVVEKRVYRGVFQGKLNMGGGCYYLFEITWKKDQN